MHIIPFQKDLDKTGAKGDLMVLRRDPDLVCQRQGCRDDICVFKP